jgi:hypothetical protein
LDDEEVQRRLVEIAQELRDSWLSAVSLRVDRHVWDQLAPTFRGPHASAGRLVVSWYRDAVLIRCRRLLAEGGRREESPRRSLARFAAIADHVTEELIANAWEEQGTTLSRELVEEQVTGVLDRAEEQGLDLLDPKAILRDAEQLGKDHEVVSRYASRAVAHRDRRRHATEAPAIADVDALIDDVLAIVQRYAALIAGVHLDSEAPDVSVDPTVQAMRLFDYRAYVEAIHEEARRRYGEGAWPPQAREMVEESVAIQFVWPETAQH